jgi:hypothetical protein
MKLQKFIFIPSKFIYSRKRLFYALMADCLFLLVMTGSYAQYRPALFLREDWKESPAATGLNQTHVANPELVLNLYGPGCDSLRKSHHPAPVDDPYYVWSGLCRGNWAVTLKRKDILVDLTGYAKIIWRSKQAGARCLHVLLKLSDGTWLVSKESDGSSKDWRVHEFNIMDLTWYGLNIKNISEMKPVEKPDLTRVEEIGFTDLMTGGGTVACSRLDWIEVYGKPVR